MESPLQKLSMIDQVIAGLMILAKYDKSVCAEHDVIYAGGGDISVFTPEDVKALEALGWRIDSSSGSYAKFV